MTELDLLTLARATTQNEISLFTQVVTISFAMIVAIFYFLNQARLAMRVFSFIAYMVGMLLFLGQMLLETNLKDTLLQTLAALPHPNAVTLRYLALNDTWLAVATRVLFNGAFWILGIGVFYLLFFWKKSAHEARTA